mgnify:CR=1 FL=1
MLNKKEQRITIVFSLKDKVGALVSVLKIFLKYKINLTRIISRPHPDKVWEYNFLIEIEDKVGEKNINKCLEEIEKHTINLYVLGRYSLTKIR